MLLIKDAIIVNDGKSFCGSVLIKGLYIYKICEGKCFFSEKIDKVIDARGKMLIPGIIDTHVHFREPGLTHKADIGTESMAAVAGGVTSYFDMPNTKPPTLSEEAINEKVKIAEKKSYANFGFYIGVDDNNINNILQSDNKKICGIKLFMGSSTGKMAVENSSVIENVFAQKKFPLVVHCEDDSIIKRNEEEYRRLYGDDIAIKFHSEIRSSDACIKSSTYAVELANKFGTKLHIAHISTEEELELISKNIENESKAKITGEVCVHHLWFDSSDYEKLGTKIKCNPSIKEMRHKKALLDALATEKIFTVATDHAPHSEEEKSKKYFESPSGIPIIGQSLQIMLEYYKQGLISAEKLVEKMCHNPARLFDIEKRGFIREGYFADLVLIDLKKETVLKKEDILYKCKWSPFEGYKFGSTVIFTIVNGNIVYDNGKLNHEYKGMQVTFKRN